MTRLVGLLRATHLAWILAIASTAFLTSAVAGDQLSGDAGKGNSSREVRRDAIRGIPYARLPRNARNKVAQVVSDTTVFRRMPEQVIECDHEFYQFLVEHPDIVVNMWQVLGISEMSLVRSGSETFAADDGVGTRGNVEFLYHGGGIHVVYADGSYEGPLFTRPVRGRCVMILKTTYTRNAEGHDCVTCRMDAFLRIDNLGVELLAKTFKPLVGSAADHNFRETAAFLASLSRTAQVNHAGVRQMALRLTEVEERHLEEFVALSEGVATKAALERTQGPRQAARPQRASSRARPSGTGRR